MKITVLKNKTRNEVDSGDLEAVGVVSKEDAMKVVVAVLEVDVAETGVGVGAMAVIGVVAVALEVALEADVVVEVVTVEVVSRVEDLGAETGITMDQENRGETMRIMIEEVLRVVSIEESLSISRHHLKIKKSLLTINIK